MRNLRRAKPLARRAMAKGAFWVALPALLAMGCSEDTARKGQLVLMISTDMAIDSDLERVDVIVEPEQGQAYNQTVDLYPQDGGLFTPGTFVIVEGQTPGEDVRVSLVARRGDESRVVRELVTTLPRGRVASVPMPIHWLCEGEVTEGGGESACHEAAEDGAQTCNLGTCVDAEVNSEQLEDFDPDTAFAGFDSSLDAARAGACFDVVRCFDGAERVDVDLGSCTFEAPAATQSMNVALVVTEDGHCNPTSGVCYVPLDRSKAFGWQQSDDIVELPPGACDRLADGRILAVVAGGDCGTKTIDVPTCGPWLGPTGSSDRDDDGIADSEDNCPDDANPDQGDEDGDGIGDECDTTDTIGDEDSDGVGDDVDNCPVIPNSEQSNEDNDSEGDACDDDDDNDGFADADDSEPLNPFVPDADGDGLAADDDNCPSVANPDQENFDGDAFGDACDDDQDQDGVDDKVDNCELFANPGQEDCDDDGVGDGCDTCDSEIILSGTAPGSSPRSFVVGGSVGTLELDSVTISTESLVNGRSFEQRVPVVDGTFTSGDLLLSAGENAVTAVSCNCSSETVSVTTAVDPADILVTLSWDTNYVDLDLYLYEPDDTGDVCYFDGVCGSSSGTTALGGQLDFDNTAGFGPENYSLSAAQGDTVAAGIYRVRVHSYSFDPYDADSGTGYEEQPAVDYEVRVLLNEGQEGEQDARFSGTFDVSDSENTEPTGVGADWSDIAEIECSGDPIRCVVREAPSAGFNVADAGPAEAGGAPSGGTAGSSTAGEGAGGSATSGGTAGSATSGGTAGSATSGGTAGSATSGGTAGSATSGGTAGSATSGGTAGSATSGGTGDMGSGGSTGGAGAAGFAGTDTTTAGSSAAGATGAGGAGGSGGTGGAAGFAGTTGSTAGATASGGAAAGATGASGAGGTGDPDDADGDTVADASDNCPVVANEGQQDSDADGVGDACECQETTYYDFETESCLGCESIPEAALDAPLVWQPGARTGYDPVTDVLTFELDPALGELASATLQLTLFNYDAEGQPEPSTSRAPAKEIARNLVTFDLSPFGVETGGVAAMVLDLVHACGTQLRVSDIAVGIEAAPASGAGDEVVHTLRQAQCGEIDLGSAVDSSAAVWRGTTAYQGSDVPLAGQCSTYGPDLAFSWTAPSEGDYLLQAVVPEQSFSPAVFLLDAECSGQTLQCGDGGYLPVGDLAAGEKLIFVVGSYTRFAAGDIEIHISRP